LSKFAIVGIGGKQIRVSIGDVIITEKISGKVGDIINLNQIFLTDEQIGDPLIENAKIEAKIIESKKGVKKRVFKMKSRKRYRRERGHRQWETKLEILKVSL
jgi:large subunit ribosomal protein L21